ncbi:MAG: hypothetical protein M1812_003753 [Candelaria pacifica]|nr:MAG: hypothetical protein M1812_003753 [Candelaria pacifica]
MSDAFSKTIPIWCYVLNRVLFPSITSSHQLYTPSDLISSSESSQIQTKLPNFVTNFQNLNLPLSKLRKSISKPLRPFWIRPNIPFPNNKNIIPFNTDIFHPLILCTASRFENVENWYVQGAGDDSEGWANGLTANLYWTNREELRRTCEGELEGLITRLVSSSNDEESREELGYKLIEPTSNIFIGTSAVVGTAATAGLSIRDPNAENFDLIIDCFSIVVEKKKKKKLKDENKKEEPSSNTTTTQQQNPTTPSPNHLTLPCGPGKQGSRALRSQLPIAIKALLSLITNLENQQSPPKQSQQQPPQNEQKHQQQQQQNQPTNPPKILLLSPPNTDLALGVGLTILSLFHDSSGNFISTRSEIENATYLSSSSSSSSTSTSSTSSSNINNNKNNNDNDDNDTNDDNTTNINTSTSPPSEIKEKLSSTPITKHLIRQRLTWLTTSLPHINLSRSTLQSVNSFLISPPPPHSSPTPINDR